MSLSPECQKKYIFPQTAWLPVDYFFSSDNKTSHGPWFIVTNNNVDQQHAILIFSGLLSVNNWPFGHIFGENFKKGQKGVEVQQFDGNYHHLDC